MSDIIAKTIDYIKKEFADAEGGHDFWHTYRVWKNATAIADESICDKEIVALAALLHDIADSKFHGGDDSIGPQKARAFLTLQNMSLDKINHIIAIIENISFKGGNEERTHQSIELDIVQDADRLEALGAVGIARAFNYGGYKNRAIYDPNVLPNYSLSKEEYKQSKAPTINHFYEKLLQLKDLFNTKKGRELAEDRHQFLLLYLKQFYKEVGENGFEYQP